MQAPKSECSSCRFDVQQSSDGNAVLVVHLYQTIPFLSGKEVGFGLLAGTRLDEAKKMAEMLNERILEMFVSVRNETA